MSSKWFLMSEEYGIRILGELEDSSGSWIFTTLL
jgi:hypothetical protein